MKKIIAVVLLVVVLLTVSGCSSAFSVEEDGYANTTKITFTLIISDDSGEEVFNSEVAYNTGSYAVYIPILEVFKDKNISYSEVDGVYDDFFGIPSIDDNGWVLYINDVEKEINKLTKVAEEDIVKIIYVR